MTKILIYTDGACSGNPGPGGWAAIVITTGAEKTLCGNEKLTTNNKMELMATIKALESLAVDADAQTCVYTDSNYVKKGITEWIFSWKKNNWRTASKTPVKNQELWMELDNLSAMHNIEWKWVKAHNGNHYNEKVDEIARAQAKLAYSSGY